MKHNLTLLFTLLTLVFAFRADAQTLPCDDTCPANAEVEQEVCGSATNDNCENAVTVSCGSTVCGTSFSEGLGGTFDTDWYTFTITENTNVTVNFNSSRAHVFSIIDNCVDQNVLAVGINDPCLETFAVTNLAPGTYLINVFPLFSFTDIWACSDNVSYAFNVVCSNDPGNCTLEVLPAVSNPTCGGPGDDGSISLFIINGEPLFNVQWDNGSTDQDLFFLTAGTYCYTVTDGLACTASDCITLSAPVCSAPANLSASGITNTKATLSWTANDCALKYRLQVRKQGTTAWTTYFLNAGATARTINNLESGNTYQYRIRSVCSFDGSVLSPFSAIETFTTGGCQTPGSPSATVVSATSAQIQWTTVDGVSKYRVRYRPQGSTDWLIKAVNHPQSSTVINNLEAATTYEYQLLSICTGTNALSAPSSLATFTTNALRMDADQAASVILYPNPSKGPVTFIAQGSLVNQVTIDVYDVLGKQVAHEQVTLNNGTQSLSRDYSSLAKGVYIIRFSNNGVVNNYKFVKE